MAPKKKGNKREEDDWEPEALKASEEAVPLEDKAQETEDQSNVSEGAGLMAAIRKNKAKKKAKGKHVDEDWVQGEDPPVANGASEGISQARIGTQSADTRIAASKPNDETLAVRNKGKAPQISVGGKTAAPKDVDQGDNADDAGAMKTASQKAKEKKEREKARKKEQATKKKLVGPDPIKPAVPATPDVKEVRSTALEESAELKAGDDATKRRKVPAHLAALQKQQEKLRQHQEALARADAVERARIEEEERKVAEEESRKEEERKRKKEKEKEKKEQLKKDGKFLTKAQKEVKQRNDLRLQQLLATGVQVEGLGATAEEKKKPVYQRKKPRKVDTKKEDEDNAAAAANEPAASEAQEQITEVLTEEQERARAEAEETADAELEASDAEAQDDVPETWDASSNDDTSEDDNAKSAAHAKSRPVIAKMADGATKKQSQDAKAKFDDEDDKSDEDAVAMSATKAFEAQRREEAVSRKKKAHQDALAAQSKDKLRSPICCILGHVDTGKTKLLDKIRQTNVQEGEAGGITQQIGATFFGKDAIQEKTAIVNKDDSFEIKVPGLLVIDTPGHESFTNLRSRGSSLCNIAILVVDIMHGLEPQTLESMKLLRDRKTPFVVALNKIDRLYGWSKIDNNGFQDSLATQKKSVQQEFRDRLDKTKIAFAEQGFNAELFCDNADMRKFVSLVPTSAHTGEGIPDLLKLIIQLTQERMVGKLMYLSEVECTVLEVKVIEGFGTTIDVILSNGVLHEGDRIVLCGREGAISTNIRALLTPPPLRELRIKSNYVHHKETKAALGVKIAANDLDTAIAGSRLLVVGPDDDEEDLEDEVMGDLEKLMSNISKSGRGVSVQSSTLGSLEALLEFLRVSKIPVSNINIGPVFKRDVMQCGTMLEKSKEYAVMLCFDVKVDKEAQQYADEAGIKIFTAQIIYHLFDAFTKHMEAASAKKKEDSKLLAVFPCVLNPVAIFNKKDPIVIGADCIDGALRNLTPLAVVKSGADGKKEIIPLGRV